MSRNISPDDAEDTDTDKQITAQRSSMHNQPWIMLGPSGTCQSMRIPVKPKQSACARGRSLRGCYTVSEQTAAYLVSRYHPRTLTDTVHFHSLCREQWHKRAPLTRQRYKAGRNRSRDLGDDGETQGRAPQRHRHLSSEENINLISFNSMQATTVGCPVQDLA